MWSKVPFGSSGNEHLVRLIRIAGVMVCCTKGGEDRVASGGEYFVVIFTAQLNYWCRQILRKAVAERYYQFIVELYCFWFLMWKDNEESYCEKLLWKATDGEYYCWGMLLLLQYSTAVKCCCCDILLLSNAIAAIFYYYQMLLLWYATARNAYYYSLLRLILLLLLYQR